MLAKVLSCSLSSEFMSQMVGEIVSYDKQITQRTLEQLPSQLAHIERDSRITGNE